MGSRPTRAMTGRLRREKRDIHEGARRTTKGHEVRWICFNGANRRKVIHPGARASRPHPFSFIEAAERQREFAGSYHAGGNANGQGEEELWRRCQSIQVAEMAEAAPRHCAGGTPALPGGLHPPVSLSPGGRAGYSCRNLSSCLSCASMCIHVQKKYRSPGAVASRSKWRRWARLCQALCGRDARAPRGIPSPAPVASTADTGRPRSQGGPFWALRAVEAAPYRFVALRGSSCSFVDIFFSFVALCGSSLFLAASFDFFSIQVI